MLRKHKCTIEERQIQEDGEDEEASRRGYKAAGIHGQRRCRYSKPTEHKRAEEMQRKRSLHRGSDPMMTSICSPMPQTTNHLSDLSNSRHKVRQSNAPQGHLVFHVVQGASWGECDVMCEWWHILDGCLKCRFEPCPPRRSSDGTQSAVPASFDILARSVLLGANRNRAIPHF